MPPAVRKKPELQKVKVFMVLLVLLIISTPVEAFWRHLCHGSLGMARIDPLMSPGKPSQHVHAIHGASNFGLDPTLEDLMSSNCTSCSIKEDKSVYWSPQLYFQHDNGTFELVPRAGGLTVYYFTEKPDVGQKITAFPKGFRMIAGNSLKRSFYGPQQDPGMSYWQDSDMTQQALMEKSIGFNCLNYIDVSKTEGSLMHHELRSKAFFDANCPSGMRAELQFPSCWNGKDLDSKNHTTHVAYPSRLRNGDCPAGFDVRLPVIFYETIFETNAFKSELGQFVFANGDPTGNGYHGDFINGWDDGILQMAIDNPDCTTTDPTHPSNGIQEECPVFHIKPDNEVTSCTMEMPESLQHEQIDLVEMLPGGVVVQAGPGFATMSLPASETSMPTTSTPAPVPTASVVSTLCPDTTVAAAPPNTTPAPLVSTSSTDSNMMLTTTSVFVNNGTTIHLVMVEEIVTTTITAEPVTTAGPVRRHGHDHSKRKGRLGRF